MAELSKQTVHFTPNDKGFSRKWYTVDAAGVSLGRLASCVAQVLKGKHKVIYTPNADLGDHVVVLNAAKVRLTGKKNIQKIKFRHSGYPGGAVYTTMKDLLGSKPERAIELAVRGMMPKTHLGKKMLLKLNVVSGDTHTFKAQKPEPMPAALMNY
jgi:large subunit ribosomal protein L13